MPETRIIREPIFIREPVYFREDYRDNNNQYREDDYYHEDKLVKSRPIIDESISRPVNSDSLSKSPTKRRKHSNRE